MNILFHKYCYFCNNELIDSMGNGEFNYSNHYRCSKCCFYVEVKRPLEVLKIQTKFADRNIIISFKNSEEEVRISMDGLNEPFHIKIKPNQMFNILKNLLEEEIPNYLLFNNET